MKLEWDTLKASQNLAKHGVSFEEAATVFDDDVALTDAADLHSEDEDRELTVGVSARNRLLIVTHPSRGDVIRIISARPAGRRERQQDERNLVGYLG